jgi:hypothetical protein
MKKLSPEDMEVLQKRLMVGPKENPPVYSAFRCFQGSEYLETLLKKRTLNEVDRIDLLFHLTVLQTIVFVFEGASGLWTDGMELFDLCGGKLARWMEQAQWPG